MSAFGLSLATSSLLVGGAAHAEERPAVVRLAKASDAERKQKKVDKAKAQFEKKLTKLRAKYLEKIKPSALARKTKEKIEKEAKSFDSVVRKLKKVEAPDAEVSALESKRDALLKEILEAHRVAQIEAAKGRIDKLLSPGNLDRITNGSDRDRERQQADFDKEIAALTSLKAPAAAIEAAKKKRRDAIAATREASAAKDQKRVRNRVSKEVRVVQPELDAPKIKPMAPTWCDGVVEAKGERFWGSFQPEAPPNLDERGFDYGYLERAVLFSCQDPEYDVRQQWVASFRQQLSNQKQLSEAHNLELMKLGPILVKEENWVRDSEKKLCQKYPPLANGTREAKATRSLERIALGCGNRLSSENRHALWDLDIEGGIGSQLALAGFVDYFVPELRGSYDNLEEGALGWVTKYVVAAAVPLDAKTFEREIAAMKLSPYGKAQARLTFYGGVGRMKVYKNALMSAAKKTPGIKKMVFDGPAASLKRFKAENARAKKVLAKVLAVEDRMGGQAAINGCGKEFFKEFKPYLKKAMKSQRKAAPNEIRFTDMEGFLLVYGMTACGRKDEMAPVLDYAFGGFYNNTSPIKGPLTAAYRGMVEGYNDAVGDQKTGGFSSARGGGGSAPALKPPDRNPIEAPELPQSSHGFTGHTDLQFLASAVVKSVQTKGDSVTAKFGTKSWKEPVLKCNETNKIDRIGSDGKIHYKFKCKKVGEKTVTFTQKPITVPKWASAGLKKGALVKFIRYSNMVKPERAWLVEVFASKKGKKRTSLLGAPL